MIDKTEEKIVRMLLKEARTSLTKIAKECNISVPSVNSRIKQLKKKEIINGAIMQINPKRLGFTCCGILQIATNPDKEKIARKYLVDNKFVIYENEHLSRSRLGVFFALPHIDGLVRMIEQIKNQPEIKDVSPIIWNDVNKIDFPENLVLTSPKKIQKKIAEDKDKYELVKNRQTNLNLPKKIDHYNIDKIDLRLAQILTEKARTPFSTIAKKIGISPNNVISRYKKLRERDIISNSSITINLKKIGYNAIVVLFLKVSASINVTMLYHQLIQKSNVIVAVRLFGPHDIMIDIPVKSFSEVFGLNKKLQQIKGIENIITELHAPFEKWPMNIFGPLLKNYNNLRLTLQ